MRQVKIGKHRPDHSKLVSRINENIRFAAAGLDEASAHEWPAAYSSVRTVVVPLPRFSSRCPRPNSSYLLPFRLRSHKTRGVMVVLHPIHPHRLEGSQANVKRNLRSLDTPRAHPRQHFWREVQTSSRGSNRTALPGIDGLIPFSSPG